MTIPAGNSEGGHHPTGPRPEALARQLLIYEVGADMSADAVAAAGERIYLRMRVRLATLLGAAGFDALWARAIHLEQPTLRLADDTAAEAVPTGAYGLRAALRGRDSAEVQQALTAVFASFISLLYTFIGEDLASRFIRQLWPDIPPDAEDSCAEGTTP